MRQRYEHKVTEHTHWDVTEGKDAFIPQKSGWELCGVSLHTTHQGFSSRTFYWKRPIKK